MATFSGASEAQLARYRRDGLCVRRYAATDALDWDLARFRGAIEVANHRRPAFVVVGGDMVDDITRGDQLEALMEAAADLDPTIPIHWVPGNHDVASDANVPTEHDLARYREVFGADNEAWTHEGATFVTINSTAVQQPRHLDHDGTVPLAFLEDELRAARDRQGPIVVFLHHPPFVAGPTEDHSYWNLPTERRMPLLELLDEHDVALVLGGHRHRNESAHFGTVQLVTSSACGLPLGADPPGYRLVAVDSARPSVRHRYTGFDDPGWDGIGGPPDPTDPCVGAPLDDPGDDLLE